MRLLPDLLDLVVPSHCDGCGEPARPPWCATCADAVGRLRPTTPCPRCAAQDRPGHPCWVTEAPVDATVALTRWRPPVPDVLTRAKLTGRREVHAALGRQLGAVAAGLGGELVVPVPTDRRRARLRGADHTCTLADALGRTLAVPVVRALIAVGRQPDRASGGGRGAGAATGTPRFAARATASTVAGRHVLLVDDVVTTGTTASVAARLLSVAGARWVTLVVVARAGRHRLGGTSAEASATPAR